MYRLNQRALADAAVMLGLVAWALNALLVLSVAYLTQRALSTGSRRLQLVSAIFSVILVASGFVLLIGLAGWLRPLPITALSALGLVVLLAVPRLRAGLTQFAPDLSGWLKTARSWWTSLPRWLRNLSALAALASAVRFAFLIWALPPFVWDSLSYHLTNVADWVQTGRIATFDTPVQRIFNPANYELLATWFAVFLHHDLVIEAAGLPPYALAVAAVYAAARGLGSSSAGALMAGLAYGSTPAVVIAATGTKNDIFMAAYYLALLALVIDAKRHAANRVSPFGPPRLVLVGLLLLVAFGTKTYILHLLPGLVLLAALGGRRGRLAGLRWRHLAETWRMVRGLRPSNRIVFGLLGALGLVLGFYWNVRNMEVTGNPFYPYDVVIAGRTLVEGPDSEFRLDVHELSLNLKGFAAKLGDKQDPIRPDLPNTTGWGWFAYGLGVPALAWALLRRAEMRPVFLGFGLSFLALFLSAGPSPWNMRFFIWFPALLALAFGLAWDALQEDRLRIIRLMLIAYTIGSLTLNFASTINYGRVSAEEFRSMLELPALERHTALFRDNMPDAYGNALALVPADQVLGYNVNNNGFVYPMFRSDFAQRVVYIPVTGDDSCRAIAAAMQARGTRYLLVAPEHTPDSLIARLRSCANDGADIRERARGIYVTRS